MLVLLFNFFFSYLVIACKTFIEEKKNTKKLVNLVKLELKFFVHKGRLVFFGFNNLRACLASNRFFLHFNCYLFDFEIKKEQIDTKGKV